MADWILGGSTPSDIFARNEVKTLLVPEQNNFAKLENHMEIFAVFKKSRNLSSMAEFCIYCKAPQRVVSILWINNTKYWWNAGDMICRQEIILITRDKTGDSVDTWQASDDWVKITPLHPQLLHQISGSVRERDKHFIFTKIVGFPEKQSMNNNIKNPH